MVGGGEGKGRQNGRCYICLLFDVATSQEMSGGGKLVLFSASFAFDLVWCSM